MVARQPLVNVCVVRDRCAPTASTPDGRNLAHLGARTVVTSSPLAGDVPRGDRMGEAGPLSLRERGWCQTLLQNSRPRSQYCQARDLSRRGTRLCLIGCAPTAIAALATEPKNSSLTSCLGGSRSTRVVSGVGGIRNPARGNNARPMAVGFLASRLLCLRSAFKTMIGQCEACFAPTNPRSSETP